MKNKSKSKAKKQHLTRDGETHLEDVIVRLRRSSAEIEQHDDLVTSADMFVDGTTHRAPDHDERSPAIIHPLFGDGGGGTPRPRGPRLVP